MKQKEDLRMKNKITKMAMKLIASGISEEVKEVYSGIVLKLNKDWHTYKDNYYGYLLTNGVVAYEISNAGNGEVCIDRGLYRAGHGSGVQDVNETMKSNNIESLVHWLKAEIDKNRQFSNLKASQNIEADLAVHNPTVKGNKVFDVDTAQDWVKILEREIKAPVVSAKVSTLGGTENVSILLVVSFDKRENWMNGYLENSRYFRMHIDNNGLIEQFTVNFGLPSQTGLGVKGNPTLPFRKTRVLNEEELVYKINRYIQLSEEFMKKYNK